MLLALVAAADRRKDSAVLVINRNGEDLAFDRRQCGDPPVEILRRGILRNDGTDGGQLVLHVIQLTADCRLGLLHRLGRIDARVLPDGSAVDG